MTERACAFDNVTVLAMNRLDAAKAWGISPTLLDDERRAGRISPGTYVPSRCTQ